MSLAALASSLGPDAPQRPSATPRRGVADPPAAPAVAKAEPEKGFALLTRYIPTETVTLYVAAVAATQLTNGRAVGPMDVGLGVYLAFAALTPLLLWLLALGEYRNALGASHSGPRGGPCWRRHSPSSSGHCPFRAVPSTWRRAACPRWAR